MTASSSLFLSSRASRRQACQRGAVALGGGANRLPVDARVGGEVVEVAGAVQRHAACVAPVPRPVSPFGGRSIPARVR